MVALFGGNGLGVFNSSLSQINGYGARGNSKIGNGSDEAYVNVVKGNLVVLSQDDYLAAIGLDVSIVRTYNSQGLLTDDNGDNWQISVNRWLENLPAHGKTTKITRVAGDGYEATFKYDVLQSNRYANCL